MAIDLRHSAPKTQCRQFKFLNVAWETNFGSWPMYPALNVQPCDRQNSRASPHPSLPISLGLSLLIFLTLPSPSFSLVLFFLHLPSLSLSSFVYLTSCLLLTRATHNEDKALQMYKKVTEIRPSVSDKFVAVMQSHSVSNICCSHSSYTFLLAFGTGYEEIAQNV